MPACERQPISCRPAAEEERRGDGFNGGKMMIGGTGAPGTSGAGAGPADSDFLLKTASKHLKYS